MNFNSIRVQSIVLLLLCITLSATFAQVVQWTSGNNHYYQYVDSAVKPADALAACSALTYKGMKGYLVTLTSLEEQNFVLQAFSGTIGPSGKDRFYISGYSAVPGQFAYNSGPEANTFLYDTLSDLSGSFTDWSTNEPNLKTLEYYIHYDTNPRVLPRKNGWNNINNLETPYQYICEFGGLEYGSFYMAPVSGEGGVAEITNMNISTVNSPFDYSKASITLSRPGYASLECVFISGTSTKITCQMPPSTGQWNVTLTDTISNLSFSSSYRYQPPAIATIYPNFNAGELLTITGQGFGGDSSKIAVNVTIDKMACNNIKIINHNAITCNLIDKILSSTPLLPITIRVDGAVSFSQKAPVFYNTTKSFFSCTNSYTTFNDALNNYAKKLRAEGLVANMGVIFDEAHATFVDRVCISTFAMWMNIKYVPSQFNYAYLDYPGRTGQTVTVDNSQGVTPTDSDANFQMTPGYLLKEVDPNDIGFVDFGTFTEFTEPTTAPIVIGSTSHTVSTDGGIIEVKTYNTGSTFSKTSLKFGSFVANSLSSNYYTNSSIFSITSGYGGPYAANLIRDGTSNTQGSITIDFEKPTIENFNPFAFPTSGGLLTIYGGNFSDNASIISVYITKSGLPNATCSNVRLITPHKVLECNGPPGFGNDHNVYVDVDGKIDYSSFLYDTPSVESASSVGVMGGKTLIKGNNFWTDPNQLNVTIGSETCQIMSSDYTQIICIIGPGSGTENLVTVSLGDISSKDQVFMAYLPPKVISATSVVFKVGGQVNITGLYFGKESLSVTIGGEACTGPIFYDSTLVGCHFAGNTPAIDNQPLEVNVTSSKVSGAQMVFLYLDPPKVCPGKPTPCSGHGTCGTDSRCICNPGWDALPDCSKEGGSGGKPTPGNNGTANYPGSSFNFTTSVTHLREMNGDIPIKTLSLVSALWTLKSNSSEDHLQLWNATFAEDGAVVDLVLAIYTEATTIDFAGEPMVIGDNSVKYTLSISNWTFASQLHTLQVIYSSRVEKIDSDSCDTTTSSTDMFNNEYQVIVGDSILRATFAGRLIADQRVLRATTIALSSTDPLVTALPKSNDITVLTAIIVPHFSVQSTVDPSFRSLISPDSDECGKENKWRLPVIIVLSVVFGCAIIAGLSMLTYKKVIQRKRARQLSLKKMEMSGLSH
eukprot:gene7619-8913_t